MSELINLPLGTGNVKTISTLAGDTVNVSYAVADIAQLVISNLLDGRINNAYPQELQPRDRTSLESKLQVNRIAHDLRPDNLSDSETSDKGSPIVGPDLVVESGNGRALGVWRAYAGGQAEEYRTWLISNAGKYGLDGEAITGLDSPILVRVRMTDIDRAQFARDSNKPSRVPEKPLLEKVMPGGAAVDRKAVNAATQLLSNCQNLEEIISLLQALQLSGSAQPEGFAYRLAITLKNAIERLKNTTPDNTDALKSYQTLVKKLLGTKPEDVFEKMDYQSQRDFSEILGINTYNLKASAWRARFSNGELWQVGGLLKKFALADEDYRSEIARQAYPIMAKYAGRGRTFDMTYLSILRQIIPSEMGSQRAGQIHNSIMNYARRYSGEKITSEEAVRRMETSSAAGRATLENIQVTERARAARDAIRKEAKELAVLMKGALSHSELSSALKYAPALQGFADYDPEQDKIFGARYSPLSSLLRSMEYASTKATIERISRVNPDVASRLNDFYARYQTTMAEINGAFKGHIDKLIDNSPVSNEQAEKWVKSLDISKAAIRDFDARMGDGAIQEELKKIYRLTNGGLKSLRKITFKKDVRAYASKLTGEVVISGLNDLSVLWHEVGHHFEFSDPSRLEKARAFLRKRMGPNEQYRLIEGTKNERAIHDSFSETYIGRVYGNQTLDGTDATEVYSMAFQCVLDSRYCANSVINNDELLDFFLGEIAEVRKS